MKKVATPYDTVLKSNFATVYWQCERVIIIIINKNLNAVSNKVHVFLQWLLRSFEINALSFLPFKS